MVKQACYQHLARHAISSSSAIIVLEQGDFIKMIYTYTATYIKVCIVELYLLDRVGMFVQRCSAQGDI